VSTLWDWFWAVVGIFGSFAGVALIVYLQARGTSDYDDEDAARAYFDREGRWPDEA
jgi:hypothetical protein